jgi:putative phosphoesterase
MRVGVLSDIHDNLANLDAALELFAQRGFDTVLFLGDFCSPIPARVLNAYTGTVHCVFGNGDGDRFAIANVAASAGGALRLHGEWAELDLGGRRVAMTHYPLYARALARTGDYAAVFSGHTHERHEERFGDTLWANPGEVLGWKGAPSVAWWDAEANAVEFVDLRRMHPSSQSPGG